MPKRFLLLPLLRPTPPSQRMGSMSRVRLPTIPLETAPVLPPMSRKRERRSQRASHRLKRPGRSGGLVFSSLGPSSSLYSWRHWITRVCVFLPSLPLARRVPSAVSDGNALSSACVIFQSWLRRSRTSPPSSTVSICSRTSAPHTSLVRPSSCPFSPPWQTSMAGTGPCSPLSSSSSWGRPFAPVRAACPFCSSEEAFQALAPPVYSR